MIINMIVHHSDRHPNHPKTFIETSIYLQDVFTAYCLTMKLKMFYKSDGETNQR